MGVCPRRTGGESDFLDTSPPPLLRHGRRRLHTPRLRTLLISDQTGIPYALRFGWRTISERCMALSVESGIQCREDPPSIIQIPREGFQFKVPGATLSDEVTLDLRTT